jgi:hypothetical protein
VPWRRHGCEAFFRCVECDSSLFDSVVEVVIKFNLLEFSLEVFDQTIG